MGGSFIGRRWHISTEILTVNYDVEQSQFVKLTPELLRWEPEESNEVFNRMFREWLL